MNGHPSTRRHPRTLHGADGAFTNTAAYGCAIERPARPTSFKGWYLALAALIVLAVLRAALMVLA